MPDERQRVSSGSPFEARIGFSRAVRVGDRVLVAGTAPIWPDGSCDPDPEAQARRCLEIIVAALREAGAQPSDVVRTRMFITNVADSEADRPGTRRGLRRGATGEHDGGRGGAARPQMEGGDGG